MTKKNSCRRRRRHYNLCSFGIFLRSCSIATTGFCDFVFGHNDYESLFITPRVFITIVGLPYNLAPKCRFKTSVETSMPTLLKNENIKKTKFEKYKKFKKDPFPPYFFSLMFCLSQTSIQWTENVQTILQKMMESCWGDQCDQIGLFFKLLGDKFSYNRSPNIWRVLWLF